MRNFNYSLQAFVYLLLSGISQFGFAQNQEVSFTQIEGMNGVTLGKVNAITKDKYGFIWLSDQTNRALVRYSGTSMKSYNTDPRNNNSLGGFYPETLDSDDKGNIWIGFYGQGLDKFNPLTNNFTHYRHDPDDPESLINDVVSWVLVDRKGMVWVATNEGLDLLDPKTGKFKHYRHLAADRNTINGNEVRKVYEDRNGNIWVGIGFAFGNSSQGGFCRYNPETDDFTRYLEKETQPGLRDNKVRAIFEDSRGNFWIGTSLNHLYRMNREKETFERLDFDPKHPEKFSPPPSKGSFSHITFITEDSDKNLWIATESSGILRYNPLTGIFKTYGSEKGGPYPDNSGWAVFSDENGLMWLSNQEAHFYEIDLHTVRFPEKNSQAINSFFQESQDIVWKGTDDGLIKENLLTGQKIRYRYQPDNPNSISNNLVYRVIKDSEGKIWVGTENGLNMLDQENGHFSRYQNSPGDPTSISGNNIRAIYEDSSHQLWISIYGGGLNKFDKSTSKFQQIKLPVKDYPSAFEGLNVNQIIEDQKQYLWLAMSGRDGIIRLSPNGDVKNYLSGLNVNCLRIDKGGIIWAGTDYGLYYFDFRQNDFLPTVLKTAVGIIVEDQSGRLWIGTGGGLAMLESDKSQFTLFTDKNGIRVGSSNRGAWNPYASALLQDGSLLLTQSNSTVHFNINPSKVKIRKDSVNLYITSFRMSGISDFEYMNNSLYDFSDIGLQYNQNTFSFRLTEVNYGKSGNKLIEYKLEGYDSGWRQTMSDAEISYFQVPPGKYKLLIRSAKTYVNEKHTREITMIISPPWWKTWWAYAIYFLITSGLITWIYRIQKQRLIRRERDRAKERELHQAKEIEKAYTELKATQAQLIQSEKMASLGELTAGIAHEIQNPLNFVNNFSEVSEELIKEIKEERLKTKDERDEALEDEILSDIEQNLQKIHHHGNRASSIVKGMLEHSRTSSGKKELTDINALADEYLRLSYHGLRAKNKDFNAEMVTDFDPNLPKIEVIPQDIGRVFLNLINNAFQACIERSSDASTEPGRSAVKNQGEKVYKPKVSITTQLITNNQLQITITDNGPGIPDAIKDKIFQPFFTTKDSGKGTGLGLSLAYDIVKAHGGELSVQSKAGEGSAFIIHLNQNEK